VEAGLFVTSPGQFTFDSHMAGGTGQGASTGASASFDSLAQQGSWPTGTWTGTDVGEDGPGGKLGGYQQAAGAYTLTGSGDIAPDAGRSGDTVEHTLTGMFAALAVLVVVAVLFITTEYRRGLIRTSLTGSPRRLRVLAAKATVVGTVAFLAGLVGAAVVVPLGVHLLESNGNFVYPVSTLAWVRILAGTAALLAFASVLALAVGTILRRSAGAVAAVIVLVVLPYILGTSGVLPAGASQWLLRVTPAAAFAIQQSLPAYHQVAYTYTPLLGYYPLAPWAGFAVLVGWTAVALCGAGYLLRRRDV
jgi:hypothetical protein